MANALPRWRGFNLLDMYIFEPGRELIRAGDSTGPGGYGGGEGDFRESDFRWMAEWGFDFARIPIDYRFWTEFTAEGSWQLRESVMERIDRVVQLGERYGVHVSLSFHRAPGYCVNPPAEPRSLWSDAGMQGMFATMWGAFARRYKGVPAARLSFDLVNEPPAAGMLGGVSRGAHERVIRRAVEAIRAVNGERLVMVNGLNYGNEPLPELADLAPGVGQSCRMYAPFGVTHYKAHWVKWPWLRKPAWPGAEHFGRRFGREELAAHFAPWGEMVERGVGVHCGEGGAFSKTPHGVVVAWMEEALSILRRHRIGWALWNLRGDFGVVDSNREDVAYEDFEGHRLDRAMLELLRRM